MNRIRLLRMQNALKQEELAKIIHVSQSSLSGYENERYEPDKKSLLRLADYFDVSVDYLLGLDMPGMQDPCTILKIPVYRCICGHRPLHAAGELLCSQGTDLWFQGKKGEEFFGLEVRDCSMEPRILDGDIVIVRKQPDANNGDVVVLQIGGNSATVKKIVKYSGGITLIGFNPKYQPVSFSDEQIGRLPVAILGRVVELRGKC
jgi:repressor LexA